MTPYGVWEMARESVAGAYSQHLTTKRLGGGVVSSKQSKQQRTKNITDAFRRSMPRPRTSISVIQSWTNLCQQQLVFQSAPSSLSLVQASATRHLPSLASIPHPMPAPYPQFLAAVHPPCYPSAASSSRPPLDRPHRASYSQWTDLHRPAV